MKQMDMKTGEIIEVKYEATATSKSETETRLRMQQNGSEADTRSPISSGEIVVVFEPNRPSYEIKKVKP